MSIPCRKLNLWKSGQSLAMLAPSPSAATTPTLSRLCVWTQLPFRPIRLICSQQTHPSRPLIGNLVRCEPSRRRRRPGDFRPVYLLPPFSPQHVQRTALCTFSPERWAACGCSPSLRMARASAFALSVVDGSRRTTKLERRCTRCGDTRMLTGRRQARMRVTKDFLLCISRHCPSSLHSHRPNRRVANAKRRMRKIKVMRGSQMRRNAAIG
mmetsp:Transcript_9702/g.29569  ORF Transcript_9702/g.29569 Transcript_9702/m.29569 type:complete len:211 (-) Transcript_9702:1818-2450(-)